MSGTVQTHKFDPIRYRGAEFECSLATTASGDTLEEMKRYVRQVVARVALATIHPPLISVYAGSRATAEYTETYKTSRAQVSLTVKATTEEGFSEGELLAKLKEALADNTRLADILLGTHSSDQLTNALIRSKITQNGASDISLSPDMISDAHPLRPYDMPLRQRPPVAKEYIENLEKHPREIPPERPGRY